MGRRIASGFRSDSQVRGHSHEAGDDAVESAALVAGALSREAQLLEVLGRLGRDVVLELHHDTAEFRGVPVSAQLDVEVHHRVGAVDLERGLVFYRGVDHLEDVLGLGCGSSHHLRRFVSGVRGGVPGEVRRRTRQI